MLDGSTAVRKLVAPSARKPGLPVADHPHAPLPVELLEGRRLLAAIGDLDPAIEALALLDLDVLRTAHRLDHPRIRRAFPDQVLGPVGVDRLAPAAGGGNGSQQDEEESPHGNEVDRAPAVEASLRACPPILGSGQADPRRMSGFA
jgi:hypothetical protein